MVFDQMRMTGSWDLSVCLASRAIDMRLRSRVCATVRAAAEPQRLGRLETRTCFSILLPTTRTRTAFYNLTKHS